MAIKRETGTSKPKPRVKRISGRDIGVRYVPDGGPKPKPKRKPVKRTFKSSLVDKKQPFSKSNIGKAKAKTANQNKLENNRLVNKPLTSTRVQPGANKKDVASAKKIVTKKVIKTALAKERFSGGKQTPGIKRPVKPPVKPKPKPKVTPAPMPKGPPLKTPNPYKTGEPGTKWEGTRLLGTKRKSK
jgi:hypothetical protein